MLSDGDASVTSVLLEPVTRVLILLVNDSLFILSPGRIRRVLKGFRKQTGGRWLAAQQETETRTDQSSIATGTAKQREGREREKVSWRESSARMRWGWLGMAWLWLGWWISRSSVGFCCFLNC